MHPAVDHSPQTNAQWAVRWHGVVLLLGLLGCVPIIHVLWHVVLGHAEPLLRTRSQVPAPAMTLANLAAGTWMQAKEKELREQSPVVWWLRANWNELRYRAGVPQSSLAHFGKDEWLFIATSIHPNVAAFRRVAGERRQFLREVKALVERAGAELFVLLVPDKSRVYPEKAFADGVMPAGKLGNYQMILDDLAAEGIHSLDLAVAIAAARAAEPDGELWFRRDTHWRPGGALVAGRAVAAALEERFGARLSPRRPMELSGVTKWRLIGDLTANLGLAIVEKPDIAGRTRSVPLSLLSDHLAEVREYYGVNVRAAAGTIAMDGKDPDAEILLLGTSFAEENGLNALSLFLGRPVRAVIQLGAAGLKPLREARAELEGGTRAKIVVWEVVERGFFEPEWCPPKW